MIALDATVRPVQCPRCRTWCLLGQCDGFKTAVTASPLGVEGYRAALLAGLGVYVLSATRKLKRVRPGLSLASGVLLAHPCASWAAVPLKAPEKPVQARVPCSSMCTGSCQECDPPPFDVAALLISELGATVIEVIEHEQSLS
jgi:hypothetical protein